MGVLRRKALDFGLRIADCGIKRRKDKSVRLEEGTSYIPPVKGKVVKYLIL
jgi:hypothetical protein